MAEINHRLDIVVDIMRPVDEINAVISALVTIHRDRSKEILEAVKKAIDETLSNLEEIKE